MAVLESTVHGKVMVSEWDDPCDARRRDATVCGGILLESRQMQFGSWCYVLLKTYSVFPIRL